ncbi:hypothetical protein [Tenuibacillus multivorans]|uniref:Uncharacterized protein n=1 Tax=Tenuibacillus multivorans TaxID=237069 RepID=A0A1H0CXM9_9BACI|nr:hypothetical protein [Tenuibacillus multivorans]GEL76133.1 hypothetical protein TMU01_03680 [Tenuibacillus multivorans]SDN62381.1 hypothetical protein SAMN05216498_2703 [Tenuibacillus multivorans]
MKESSAKRYQNDREVDDVLNLPPRSKKHQSRFRKEKNQLLISQIILKGLVTIFIFLIISIPFIYYFWLQ